MFNVCSKLLFRMKAGGVPSRQWSTGTLEAGLDCLDKHSPASLLAMADNEGSKEDTLQQLQAWPWHDGIFVF